MGEPLPGGKGTARASLRVADQRDSWSVLYAAPPEDGVEATFVVPVGEPLDLTVADISDGLPDVPGQLFAPRPADITQQHFADGTVVFRRFAF